jgi:hypothetical protein
MHIFSHCSDNKLFCYIKPFIAFIICLLMNNASANNIFSVEILGSFGNNHTCEVKRDGTLACWGADSFGQSTPPEITNHDMPLSSNPYTNVSTDGWHSCALKADGTAVCWGRNYNGQTDVPVGQFSQIDAGTAHTCAVQVDGMAVCWGNNASNEANPPVDVYFAEVSAGSSHTCGLTEDNTILCWGLETYGRTSPPDTNEIFSHVYVGSLHSCGLRSDGGVTCWGNNTFGQTNTPQDSFLDMDVGGYHACGIKADDQTVVCWGDNRYGQSTPPAGTFYSIKAGFFHTCGIKTDCSVECWGNNTDDQTIPPSDLAICPMELEITQQGTGEGIVNSSPVGVDCGVECKAYFALDEIVTLEALPAGHSTFQGWGGDCQGTDNPLTLVMDEMKSCWARFSDPWLITLSHFSAFPAGHNMHFQWETATEHNSVHFRLWQAKPAHGNCQDYTTYRNLEELTLQPIKAQGGPMTDMAYSYQTPKASPGQCYGLEEADTAGRRHFYIIGPGIKSWMALFY